MKKIEAGPAHPSLRPATRLVTGGRDAVAHGFVNPPVHHVSTVLYPSAEDFIARRARYLYGRRGTPTSEALENALRELEGEELAARGRRGVGEGEPLAGHRVLEGLSWCEHADHYPPHRSDGL